MLQNPQETAELVIFTEETLNGKLHFLCSAKFLILGSISHSASCFLGLKLCHRPRSIHWSCALRDYIMLACEYSFEIPYWQSSPYENHCKCYKKLTSRSWPMLYTLTYFFSYTYKSCCDRCFPQQITLFNYICYKTILVWKLVSIWLTNTTVADYRCIFRTLSNI